MKGKVLMIKLQVVSIFTRVPPIATAYLENKTTKDKREKLQGLRCTWLSGCAAMFLSAQHPYNCAHRPPRTQRATPRKLVQENASLGPN